MRIGSLFAGIGGFDLAAEWMGWSTAWFSEIDKYASRVLTHHWPDVPNYGDIRAIDWATVEPVDVLTAGFPCQPHSLAGRRAGSHDERDLFDEIIRAAGVLRPRYIVLENVPGLFTSDDGRFFGRVLGALAALGYDAEWRVLSAADVGAPHRRERVWIVAYAAQLQRNGGNDHAGQRVEEQSLPKLGDGGRTKALADAASVGLPRPWEPVDAVRTATAGNRQAARFEHGRAPEQWRAEPDVGRVAHGVPARVDRLRCLGNAIVPACAYRIYHLIAEREQRMMSEDA